MHGVASAVFALLAAQPFMTIFLVLGLGHLLGRVTLGFFSVGSTAGSLLVALVVGALAFSAGRRALPDSRSAGHDVSWRSSPMRSASASGRSSSKACAGKARSSSRSSW